MIEAAISRPAVVLVAGQQRQRLIASLLNCLPPECRTEFSFSTGLRYSPRRPFRLVCVAGDPADQRRLLRQYDVTVLELSGKPPMEFSVTDSWGGFVSCAVATGNTAFLSSQLSQGRPGLQMSDLGALGNQLLEVMADSQTAELAAGVAAGAVGQPTNVESQSNVEATETASSSRYQASAFSPEDNRRADAPHVRFEGSRESAASDPAASEQPAPDMTPEPSQVLSWHRHEAVESLERLDDLVFEAIAGKPGAARGIEEILAEGSGRIGPRFDPRITRAVHQARPACLAGVRRWRADSQSSTCHRGHGRGVPDSRGLVFFTKTLQSMTSAGRNREMSRAMATLQRRFFIEVRFLKGATALTGLTTLATLPR